MKKVLIAMVALLCIVSMAYALGDIDNNNDNRNTNTAISSATGGRVDSSIRNDVDNANFNANTNRNENRNTNMQGQLQGQLQGQKQTNIGKVTTDVKVEGDTIKSTAIGFPSVSAAEGTSSASATYLFGSLGKANTETYKKIIPEIQAILAISDNILSVDMKKDIIATLVKKMTDANRTQRFLSIGWEDNSKNLLNLFGLLTIDSFWDEGQRPFQSKEDMKAEKLSTTPAVEAEAPKVETKVETGNAGNLPAGNQTVTK